MTLPRPLLRLTFATCLSLLPALLGGCATSAQTTTEEATVIDLRRGMTREQVKAILGDPAEVQVPQVESSANIEVWVYRRNVGSRVDSVAPTIMTEPWVDPLTGTLYYLERPNPSERRVDFLEELHLYFASGVLTEANRSVRRDYKFSSQ
jgi:hypothetical protein